MKKLNELLAECRGRAFNVSFSYQGVTDYSVEIYTGYKNNYEEIFYTDGHIKPKKAINKALKFIKNL
jgi:hypothetical protein